MHLHKNYMLACLQRFTLTFILFAQNDLIMYAAAGAFGFLGAFVPVAIMICTVLVRIFHTKPETLLLLLEQNRVFFDIIDVSAFLDLVTQAKSFGIFEIILGITLFWLAHRFFLYLARAFRQIFRKHQDASPFFISLISFLSEVILIVAICLFIVVMLVLKAFFAFIIAQFKLSKILPTNIIDATPFAIQIFSLLCMFLLVTAAYRYCPRTKPPLLLCIKSSSFCTACFFVVSLGFKLFVNINRFNIIYGVLSNVIVALLEVFAFFILVLFFAQYIFVHQCFDLLIVEQLYLIAPRTTKSPKEAFLRSIFTISSVFEETLKKQEMRLVNLKKDEELYGKNCTNNFVYYLVDGELVKESKNKLKHIARCSFFGEEECVLASKTKEAVKACTPSTVLVINGAYFAKLLEFSAQVNNRVMRLIASAPANASLIAGEFSFENSLVKSKAFHRHAELDSASHLQKDSEASSE